MTRCLEPHRTARPRALALAAAAPRPAWWGAAVLVSGLVFVLVGAGVANSQDKRVTISPSGVEVVDINADSTEGVRATIDWQDSHIEVWSDKDEEAGSVRVHAPFMHIDADASDLVRVFDDAHVRAGERVQGAVVAVFGSATVEGEVDGDVVAVFGSVRLAPGARVEGSAVAVGGSVFHPAGATINGESVSLSFMPIAWGLPTTATLLAGVALIWFVSLLLGALLFMLFPDRMVRVSVTASRRTTLSLVIGMLSVPMAVMALVLLLVTLIGIPIAMILPFVYALAVWAGQMAVTYVIGCRVLRRPLGEGKPWAPLLAGTGLIALFFVLSTVLSGPAGVVRTLAMFFGLAGSLLVIGLSVIGIGALIVSKLGAAPFEMDGPAASAEVPPSGGIAGGPATVAPASGS